MPKKIRILLADDHALVREGVRRLFNDQQDMEVVAEAEDGLQALRLVELHAPAIAVVDVSMPGLDGMELAQRMTKSSPHVRIIALTRHTDGSFVRRMLDAGAKGYVLKQSAGTELTRAVRAVAAGDHYIDGSVRGITDGNAAVPQTPALILVPLAVY